MIWVAASEVVLTWPFPSLRHSPLPPPLGLPGVARRHRRRRHLHRRCSQARAPSVHTCLVTGNLQPIGWTKMRALGVEELFTCPRFGGFGSDFCSGNVEEMWRDRAEFVRIAAERCRAQASASGKPPPGSPDSCTPSTKGTKMDALRCMSLLSAVIRPEWRRSPSAAAPCAKGHNPSSHDKPYLCRPTFARPPLTQPPRVRRTSLTPFPLFPFPSASSLPPPATFQHFHVGDTPMDIQAAEAAGAVAVAVATGVFTKEALQACSPNAIVLDSLASLPQALAALGLPTEPLLASPSGAAAEAGAQ